MNQLEAKYYPTKLGGANNSDHDCKCRFCSIDILTYCRLN